MAVRAEPVLEIDPALEADYNLRARHPERPAVYAGFEQRSRAFHEGWAWRDTVRYGAHPRCRIDLYLPGAEPADGHGGLLVFIHGGYWRALEADSFRFIAQPHVRDGAAVALLEYPLAPEATLTEIVGHTRVAMQSLKQRLQGHGREAARIVLSGHSAGAQLAALALGEWAGRRHLLGISGLYDLAPLCHTSVHRDVRFTPDEVQRFSPMDLPVDPGVEALLVVGGLETPGFRAQTRRYAHVLQAGGSRVQAWIAPERTHFDVLEEFVQLGSPMYRYLVKALQP